jgi:hypothetical protein
MNAEEESGISAPPRSIQITIKWMDSKEKTESDCPWDPEQANALRTRRPRIQSKSGWICVLSATEASRNRGAAITGEELEMKRALMEGG